MFYNPVYIKIFKSLDNYKLTWENLKNVSKDELEILYKIDGMGNWHPIFKWLPCNLSIEDLGEVLWDYTIDHITHNFRIEPRLYCDRKCYRGYKRLHKEKGWFVLDDTTEYMDENNVLKTYDTYIKVRRIITEKDPEDGLWLNKPI